VINNLTPYVVHERTADLIAEAEKVRLARRSARASEQQAILSTAPQRPQRHHRHWHMPAIHHG
jgi:hypothetical protein